MAYLFYVVNCVMIKLKRNIAGQTWNNMKFIRVEYHQNKYASENESSKTIRAVLKNLKLYNT